MSQATLERAARSRGAVKVVSCTLYPDQIEALARLSEREDIKPATLIRHAVARFLADHPESQVGG